MVNDPQADVCALVVISRAAEFFPNRPGASSIWRWAIKGSKGIILRTVVIGARRYTSREWCREFIEACSRANDKCPGVQPPKECATKKRRTAAAHAVLNKAGI